MEKCDSVFSNDVISNMWEMSYETWKNLGNLKDKETD